MSQNEGEVIPNVGIVVPGAVVPGMGFVVPGRAASPYQPLPPSAWTTLGSEGSLGVGFGSNLSTDSLHPSSSSASAVLKQLKEHILNELIDEGIQNARIRSSQEDAYLKLHAHLRELGFDLEASATETVIDLAVALIQEDRASVLESVSEDTLIREIFRRRPCDLVSNIPDVELKVHSVDTFQDIPTLTPLVDIRVKVPRI